MGFNKYWVNLLADKKILLCKFLGFCSGAVEVSVCLGYGKMSLGDQCLMFQDSIVV
jgi:hypothetical protein